ncbi:MAG TPA: hypothetical protein VGH93_08825 [Solirubrobacteraceae bacterium]
MSSSKRPPKKPARARPERSRARAASSAHKAPSKKPAAKEPAVPKPPAAARPAPLPLPKPKPLPTRPVIPPSRPGIRLAGSASSRLTIKPSQPTGPRPQLQLSTKVRPSGPRKLSEVELDEDEVLIDGFDATLAGEKVRITAVLERTCVYVDGSGDRRLVRKDELWVEADKLPIRRRGLA